MDKLLKSLRIIPGFPKPGINFCDVTSWLQDPASLHKLSQGMRSMCPFEVDKFIGIDARGFIPAYDLAQYYVKPLVLARKPGKLPIPCDKASYKLEYGEAEICVERNSIHKGENLVIVDDLLATGGTIGAVASIAEMYEPKTITAMVWIELVSEGLKGREFLEGMGVNVLSLVKI